MKNPGWANNRGSPPDASRNSSYEIPLLPNAPAAMILKAKTTCGDEDDSLSNLGLCSDLYVSDRVPTETTTSTRIPGSGMRILSSAAICDESLAGCSESNRGPPPAPGRGRFLPLRQVFTHGPLLMNTAQFTAGWGVNQGRNRSLMNLTRRSHPRRSRARGV
jgi:hypothetical protein